jgi:hypothetical protein
MINASKIRDYLVRTVRHGKRSSIKMELQESLMGMTWVGRHIGKSHLRSLYLVAGLTLTFQMTIAAPPLLLAQATDPTKSPVKTPPVVGTIKNINGNTIVLTNEAGSETRVLLSPEVKFLRVPPDSKDLKSATPIQLSDLQLGDRILVRGKPGDDAGTFVATTIISMKKSDLEEKKAHDQDEWQRHGIGGLVKKVDQSSGVVTIGTMSATGAKDVSVNIGKATILRRYAESSVKFDDAKASSFDEIRPGDQLRARGAKSDDGSSFAADEVVTGSFRNVSGTVTTVDAAAGTITVADLLSNKSVTVVVKPDTQLRKLPAPMAQMIAARLKGATSGAVSPSGTTPPGGAPNGMPPGSGQNKNGAGGGGARGDLQQMLSRLPASGLGDFQKGDALLVVATASSSDAKLTAITVVGGVEIILQATSQSQAASILSPWSLSGGGDAGTP